MKNLNCLATFILLFIAISMGALSYQVYIDGQPALEEKDSTIEQQEFIIDYYRATNYEEQLHSINGLHNLCLKDPDSLLRDAKKILSDNDRYCYAK